MTVAPLLDRPVDRRLADRAGRLLWIVFGLFLSVVLIGVRWDRAWHATHWFEDFWSPPHLFIYATFTLAAGFLARLVVWPPLRARFGPAINAPVLSVRIPGVLMIACGGFALIGAGGLLDSVWHSTFGLDETGWSLPHAALGWGMLLALIGLVACRLALRSHREISVVARAFLGFLLLSALIGVVTGPLGNNNTLDVVRELASLPVLAQEPDAQRMFRIYVEAGLTRGNALFVPLSAPSLSGLDLSLLGTL